MKRFAFYFAACACLAAAVSMPVCAGGASEQKQCTAEITPDALSAADELMTALHIGPRFAVQPSSTPPFAENFTTTQAEELGTTVADMNARYIEGIKKYVAKEMPRILACRISIEDMRALAEFVCSSAGQRLYKALPQIQFEFGILSYNAVAAGMQEATRVPDAPPAGAVPGEKIKP
jgi:hypothetical protein